MGVDSAHGEPHRRPVIPNTLLNSMSIAQICEDEDDHYYV